MKLPRASERSCWGSPRRATVSGSSMARDARFARRSSGLTRAPRRIVTEWMASGVAERAFRRSGNMLFPGAAAPLLAYLQQEEPASLQAAATAGYCKDAIVQRLTGVRATDASDASLPFFDPRTRAYDEELLALYDVAQWRDLLAPVDPFPAPLRELSETGASLTGLPMGTPVHAGPFDLCASMIGAGVQRPGDGLVILGTTLGCAVLVDRVETDGPLAGMLLCMPERDRWVRVMPAMVGTPSLEWVLDADRLAP